MNRQWKGIVFMDFRDENAPHFILNLIEELQRENIVESIAPCQTFAKSFMMFSPASGRRDLVLLLRPLDEKAMAHLEIWRKNQGEQTVMILSEYVKQYTAEFTGIAQPVKTNDSDKKIEQKEDNPPQKGKKGRKKRNRPSEQVDSNDESKSGPEMPVTEDIGTEEGEEVLFEENGEPDEVEIEGT
jgi:hypothetical protein